MTEYALVGPEGQIKTFRSDVDPAAGVKAGWRWLPVVETNPTFDGAAEVKEGPTVAVEASRVTRVWTVRAKTAQEISADKDNAIGGLNGNTYAPLLKVILNLHNRVRSLEGQGPHTMAQLKTAIKALL